MALSPLEQVWLSGLSTRWSLLPGLRASLLVAAWAGDDYAGTENHLVADRILNRWLLIYTLIK